MYNTKLLLSSLSIILFIFIMFWINYLVYENYIVENKSTINNTFLEKFTNNIVSSVFLDDSSKNSEKIILNNNNTDNTDKVPNINLGINTWSNKFLETQKIFDKRYKPSNMMFEPNYKDTYSLTGLFKNSGPLPSNYKI